MHPSSVATCLSVQYRHVLVNTVLQCACHYSIGLCLSAQYCPRVVITVMQCVWQHVLLLLPAVQQHTALCVCHSICLEVYHHTFIIVCHRTSLPVNVSAQRSLYVYVSCMQQHAKAIAVHHGFEMWLNTCLSACAADEQQHVIQTSEHCRLE